MSAGVGAVASIEVGSEFVYVGGQRFTLRETADAEQHLYVVADSSRTVQRMVWLQFEELLTAAGSYNYSTDGKHELGGVEFAVNVREYASPPDAASDRARAFGFVTSRGYRVPDGGWRIRFVYVPDSAARRELMIIYLETPQAEVPNPGEPAGILQRASSSLTVHRAS